MKEALKLTWILIVFMTGLLGCQEVAEDLNPLNKIVKKDHDNGGNGEGFDGIRVIAPMIAQPGQAVEVKATGGSGSYEFKLLEGRGDITRISEDKIIFKAPIDVTEDLKIVIQATDDVGAQGQASFWVAKLEASAPSKFFHFNNASHFGFRQQLIDGQAIVYDRPKLLHPEKSHNINSQSYVDELYAYGKIYVFEETQKDQWDLSQTITFDSIWEQIKDKYLYISMINFATDGEWMAIMLESKIPNYYIRQNVDLSVYDPKYEKVIVMMKKGFDGKWNYDHTVLNPDYASKHWIERNKVLLKNGHLFVPIMYKKDDGSYDEKNRELQVYKLNGDQFQYDSHIVLKGYQDNVGRAIVFENGKLFVNALAQVKIYDQTTTGWELKQTLTKPKDGPRGFNWEAFGLTIATQEDKLFVHGRGYYDDNVIYIFKLENDHYIYQQKIQKQAGLFGHSILPLSKDLIAITEPAHQVDRDRYGSANTMNFHQLNIDEWSYSKRPRHQGEPPLQGRVHLYKWNQTKGAYENVYSFIDHEIHWKTHSFFGRTISYEQDKLMIANPESRYINVYRIPEF